MKGTLQWPTNQAPAECRKVQWLHEQAESMNTAERNGQLVCADCIYNNDDIIYMYVAD